MSLQQELNLPQPIGDLAHEAIMNIAYTGEILSKEAHRILRPLGLTDSQFNVLMILKYQSENGAMNQTELGRRLLVNRSNVTGLVDRMEQAGWLRRHAAEGDRRINLIQLTPSGQALLEQAESLYFSRIHAVMKTLSAKEQTALCTLLEKIRASIAKQSS